jgi:DNA-binding transcriptional MocR family regulator
VAEVVELTGGSTACADSVPNRSLTQPGRTAVQTDRGSLPENRPIPAKGRLVYEYSIAKGSVERALDVLKAEVYVWTVSGRGMSVVPAADRAAQREGCERADGQPGADQP